MKKQALAKVISISLALGLAAGGEAVAQPSASGFYGGVTIRDHGSETQAVAFGPSSASASRIPSAAADEPSSRASTLFGGYRWANDVAVEASFGSFDKYTLAPMDAAPRGVGLNLARGAGSLTELASRTWNFDVLTSWSFLRSFSLYGRLGYAQGDASPAGIATATPGDSRRLGVSYGVGLRYDVTPSLGLRLEYSRFGRFAGEVSSTLPDSDQVSVGLQLRF